MAMEQCPTKRMFRGDPDQTNGDGSEFRRPTRFCGAKRL